MKVVLQQCCTLGRVRPAPLAVAEDVHGPTSPSVLVRALPRPGVPMFALRSRSGVLQPDLLERESPRATSGDGRALPEQLGRPTQACRALRALARTTTFTAPSQRGRRRQ